MAMWLGRLRRYLLPGQVEQDPGFRKEIERLSRIGLMVVGGVEIVASIFMAFAYRIVAANAELVRLHGQETIALVVIGVVTLAVSRVAPLRRFGRVAGSASALLSSATLVWSMLMMTQFEPTADDFIPGQIALIVLVAVTAIPFRPTDTLFMGFLIECLYVYLARIAEQDYGLGSGVKAIYVLFIFMLTNLATALSAVVYDQRRSTYEWHISTLEAAENLRMAEARNLLSQNAASVGRLAAALSHELNSPIGALVSGVDTLLLLTSRQAASSTSGQTADQQRLVLMQSDLRKSIKASTDRLREIVARMQRFTNLDQAEVQSANVNMILSDVAALLEGKYKGKAQMELDLQPVPQLVCRPQQLSAVFSNLLGNAIEASEEKGTVKVLTREVGAHVEITIEDSGRGLAKEQLETIFDPGFKVSHGRVSTGNWSMFSSRQIVQEHGGDIAIESSLGHGTRVTLKLPYENEFNRLT